MPHRTFHARRLLPWSIALSIVTFGVTFADTVNHSDVTTYEDDVLPVFRNHCLSCHNTEKKKADIDLSVYSSLISADIVAPGDLDDSLLYQVVSHAEKPTMPPDQPRIPDEDLAKIRRWIEGGLVERSGAKAMARKKAAVVGLSEAPTGRPQGPACVPVDALLEPVVKLERPATIAAMACAPWAPLIAVGARHQVLVYDAEELDIVAVLPFPEGTPQVIRFSRSGTLLLAGGGRGGHSGRVVLWDVASSRRVCEVGDELDSVLAADISPDHTEIALGGSSKLVQIYSTSTGEKIDSLRKHAEWITGVEYSPDGVLLATADRDGGLFVWESFSRQLFQDLRGHDSGVAEVSWRGDSNVLASGGQDGQAFLWDMNKGNVIKKWRAHGPGLTSIAYAADGRLVTSGRDRIVKTWQGDGKGIRAFTGLSDIATVARIDESGTRIVGGDWAGHVIVWNDANATPHGRFEPAPDTIAERSREAEKTLDEVSTKLEGLDEVRLRGAKVEATARNALAKSTEVRDAAAAVRAEADTRFEQAKALVSAIESAIAAAEAIGSGAGDAIDVTALLATQRELLEPATKVQQMASDSAVVAQKNLEALEAPLAKATGRHTRAETELTVAARAADTAREQVAEIRRRLAHWAAAAINVERLQVGDEIEEAEVGLASVTAERDAIAEEVTGEERELNDARGRADAIATGRSEHETSIAAAVAAVRAANREIGTLRDALRVRAELVTAANALLESVTERAAADPESEALRDALAHSQSTVEALVRDRDRAQSDLDAHRVQVAAEETTRVRAVAALADFEASSAKLPAEATHLERELQATRERLDAKHGEVESQQIRVESLRERFDQVDARYREALVRSRSAA